MSEYFRTPKYLGGNVKTELGSSNYATKLDLKNATSIDVSDFAKKSWFCLLKIVCGLITS